MEVSNMAWYVLLLIGWLYITLKLPGLMPMMIHIQSFCLNILHNKLSSCIRQIIFLSKTFSCLVCIHFNCSQGQKSVILSIFRYKFTIFGTICTIFLRFLAYYFTKNELIATILHMFTLQCITFTMVAQIQQLVA